VAKRYEVPRESEITYTYRSGVKVYCNQGPDRKNGTEFEGEQGVIYVNRGKLESTPAEILSKPLTDEDVRLYESRNHLDNWYECIKSRKTPICDVEVGHRSATVCHLGNIACRLGRRIVWNPEKEEISGDTEAAAMLMYEYRAPWRLPTT
jgi:hypothetical protein